MDDKQQTSQLKRHAYDYVQEALADTRGVLVVGARQVGKSTLVTDVAQGCGPHQIRTLDDPQTLVSAQADPTTFVQSSSLMVIDELQRAPELILPLKLQMDNDNRRGQYLLTGSAQVFALKTVPDTLPGRISTIELWPLSQSEIENTQGRILDRLFAAGRLELENTKSTRDEIWQRVLRGGFPDAVTARSQRARSKFLDNYATDIVMRGVDDIAGVNDAQELIDFAQALAEYNGCIIVMEHLSQAFGIPRTTLNKYMTILELSFFIKQLPAWSNSATTRATKARKLVFVDSGVAGHLARLPDELDISRPECGRLVETFVLMELARLSYSYEPGVALRHFRNRDGVEVDGVLVRRGGHCVLVEVKASATLRHSDFRNLSHVAQRLGSRFVRGVVFYSGNQVLSFGNNMWAVPISALWSN